MGFLQDLEQAVMGSAVRVAPADFQERLQNINTPSPWANLPQQKEFLKYTPESLWTGMQKTLGGITPDTRGISAYREQALRTGPSAWANLAGRQQEDEALRARSAAAGQAAGGRAQAESALAMRGGLESGARERIAKESQRNLLGMGQDISRNLATNRMQIGLSDEQNRMAQLGALPGMEYQALQPQFEKARLEGQAKQFDIGEAGKSTQAENQYNLQKYQGEMAGWGAEKAAGAMEKAGKKS